MENSGQVEDEFGYHPPLGSSRIERVLGKVVVLGVLLVVLGITTIALFGAKAIEFFAQFF